MFYFGFFLAHCAEILYKYKILFGGFIRKGASFREEKVANQLFLPPKKFLISKITTTKTSFSHIPLKILDDDEIQILMFFSVFPEF